MEREKEEENSLANTIENKAVEKSLQSDKVKQKTRQEAKPVINSSLKRIGVVLISFIFFILTTIIAVIQSQIMFAFIGLAVFIGVFAWQSYRVYQTIKRVKNNTFR